MSNINLIYIHLGENFIEYLNDSIQQSYLFNPNIKITVVVNCTNKSKITDTRVELISYEKLHKTMEHKTFLENHKMKSSRNGFWIYTIERFFVLYEVMKKLNIGFYKKTFLILKNVFIIAKIKILALIIMKNYLNLVMIN